MSVKKYLGFCFSFRGRLNRKDFTMLGLGLIFLASIFNQFLFALEPLYESSIDYKKLFFAVMMTVTFLVFVLSGISFLSVQARRLHDLNFSGWWLVLIVSFYLLMSILGQDMLSFQSLSYSLKSFIVLILLLLNLGYLVVMCSVKGVKGSNKYGPDPLASS